MNKYYILLLITGVIISCSDSQPSEDLTQYHEPHRPQFHFSPPQMWMNDPNGMVFIDGVYHLFYQHYPDSNVWGPMHWGHAVSTDLVSWQNRPIALYPDSLGYIYSGSAVFDKLNTSGLGSADNPPLVAIFTHSDPHGEKRGEKTYQVQSLAYSLDKGNTWTKYESNPVLANPGIIDFRDPKVFWYEPDSVWVMSLAVKNHIEFYRSPDLIHWERSGEFGTSSGSHAGVWECPDLFELTLSDTDDSRWVLLVSINPGGPNGGSATQYFVGNFNGLTFIPDPEFLLENESAVWLDGGRDNYAGVTWDNIPQGDGRRIFLGWMSNWDYGKIVPTYKWRSAMTLPRKLTLVSSSEGLRVAQEPVKELERLRNDHFSFPEGILTAQSELLRSQPGHPLLAEFRIRIDAAEDLELHLKNDEGELVRFGFDSSRKQFYIDRTRSGEGKFSNTFANKAVYFDRVMESEEIELEFYIDAASIELFADKGTAVLTEIFFPSSPFHVISNGSPGELQHSGIDVYYLNSIWQ